MFKKAVEKLEKVMRNYGTVQYRIKQIEDIAYALGKNGVSIDEALISSTLKDAKTDIKNFNKYCQCFLASFNEGWAEYSRSIIDKYSEGYSMDIPR